MAGTQEGTAQVPSKRQGVVGEKQEDPVILVDPLQKHLL